MPPITLSYVLPVHNQEHILAHSVSRLHERLSELPGSEIVLVENGSSDASAELCLRLAADQHSSRVAVCAVDSPTGMGHALRRGMQIARGEVVVLTAADLPFGFTDLDAFLAEPERPRLAIGSKAHPRSRVDVSLQRRLMSGLFRGLRAAVLGLRVGDSQGTVFLESRLARRILPHLACGDFLISTEVVCWAIQFGAHAVELPVVYPRSGGTTVSPLRDSARMAAGLFALRHRLRAAPVGWAATSES